jgi:hypothetical protein
MAFTSELLVGRSVSEEISVKACKAAFLRRINSAYAFDVENKMVPANS